MLTRLEECVIELAQLTKDIEEYDGTVYGSYFRTRAIEVRNEIAYLNEKEKRNQKRKKENDN